MTRNIPECVLCAMILALALAPAASSASEPIEILDACFRADVPFPEFAYFWGDSSPQEIEMTKAISGTGPMGGTLHVYLRNSGSETAAVEDVSLQGIGLSKAIAFSDQRKFKRVARAASIYFSEALSKSDLEQLIAAGEPVWWKVEPRAIEPGKACEIVVRLRRQPKGESARIGIKLANGGEVNVTLPVASERPSLPGVCFSPALDTVYLYARHPKPGSSPSRIILDGREITDECRIGLDARAQTVPVVCRLSSPLRRGSLYCFQVVYEDGSMATAATRPWGDEFAYGLWGARPGKEEETEIGRAHVQDMALHNINLQLPIIGSAAVAKFMGTEEGRKMLKELGIRRIVSEPEKSEERFAFYLADEPDTADFRVTGVPAAAKIGCIGQGLVEHAESLRKLDTLTPNMINVDMTFKPENWYTYGQLADIFAADPYYQTRLAQVYRSEPHRLPAYSKATFVYAVAAICNSACDPKPLHIMLNSVCSYHEGEKFRFATPEEKRIEVYYALAAGAKQICYWWFTPLGKKETGAHGCGAPEPEARALWREIGLLGAEARTAGPIIIRSCPAEVTVKAPRRLWTRSLLAGLDTLVLLCVNDNYLNDRAGTVIRPIENAELAVDLPNWLEPKSVFEINFSGTRDVKWDRLGSTLNLWPGRVEVTRMIVITSDAGLRESLQKLYDTQFAANVAGLKTSQ